MRSSRPGLAGRRAPSRARGQSPRPICASGRGRRRATRRSAPLQGNAGIEAEDNARIALAREVRPRSACPMRPQGVLTSVPTRSPLRMRTMFLSSSTLNTWIGSLFSMQSVSAVASMMPAGAGSPPCGDLRDDSAAESTAGRRCTPLHPFFAIRIASAWISLARSAAAVSVVKNGFRCRRRRSRRAPSRGGASRAGDVRLGDLLHGHRGLHARVDAGLLASILKREGVQDSGEHPM